MLADRWFQGSSLLLRLNTAAAEPGTVRSTWRIRSSRDSFSDSRDLQELPKLALVPESLAHRSRGAPDEETSHAHQSKR
jgi:hypothetical protein